jgi:hypothetical protein
VLVHNRLARGPRRLGHARSDVGTDNGVDSDPGRDTGPGNKSDSDSAATTGTDEGGSGRGAYQFPVTLGQHQLHAIHSGW